MEKVLITGGSGLIGTLLTKKLLQKNFEVVHLSRREDLSGKIKKFKWDIDSMHIDANCLEGVSHIVHLAGEGIADKRWSEKRKKLIIDSRINSVLLLNQVIKKSNAQIKSFTGASAVGIYGAITSDKIFNETDSPANDFLGHCCQAWEASYQPVIQNKIRTVILRIGIVLSPDGGALKKMLAPVKMGFGSPLGSGQQYVPWIDIEDMCNLFVRSIEDENMRGIYNCAAPQHLNNKELTIAIAKRLNKKLWAPKVPSWILKLMFGEMSKVVLEGSRVSSAKLLSEGFVFKFSDIESSLKETKI